jgi:hypothetical protein
MSASALEVSNPFGEFDGGWQTDGQVDVVVGAANGMEEGFGSFERAVCVVLVG